MKVRELREGLSSLRTTLKSWQANKSSQKDIERLEILLSGFDDMTVVQFCNRVEKALSGNNSAKPQRKPKLNQDAIDHYIAKLGDIGEDKVQFQSIFADIKADKRVRLIELIEIANAYIGNEQRYKKKADALKDIELTFGAKVSTSQRLEHTSEIF